jgi:hypothetical protein
MAESGWNVLYKYDTLLYVMYLYTVFVILLNNPNIELSIHTVSR